MYQKTTYAVGKPRIQLHADMLFSWLLRMSGSNLPFNQRKSPSDAEAFSLVDYVQSNWNLILGELSRWIQLTKGTSVVSYFTAAD